MLDMATSSMLLDAIKNGASTDEIVTLRKELASKGEGPTDEQRAWFSNNKGKRVFINNTNHTGIVESLNEATSGFYPGKDYPVYVRLETSNALYEYTLYQLTLDTETK